MVDKTDGGAPLLRQGAGFGTPKYEAVGLSKREWFAGMALTTIDVASINTEGIAHTLARRCFAVADAMIAESQKDTSK